MTRTRPPKTKNAVRWLIYTLILTTTLVCSLDPKGWAMLAPASLSAQTRASASQRAADMKIIQAALESKVLRQRLKEYGLDDKQIDSRLAGLSDSQAHQFAAQLHSVNPGGDAGGFIIAVLFITLLVLCIIWLVHRV